MYDLHDIPGTQTEIVEISGFATSDDGKRRVVFVAPSKIRLKSVKVYMQGPTAVGQGTNYFTLTLYSGANAIGSVAYDTAVPWLTPKELLSGEMIVPANTVLSVGYGTVGSGLAAPSSTVLITFEGA